MSADESGTLTKTLATSKAAAPQREFSDAYGRWLLFLLLAVTAVSYADRVIVQVLGQSIKQDLGLSDLQLGLLSGLSFALLYSIAGFPIARLSERHSRVGIISISVAIFSVMTALCGMAQQFWQLIAFRVGVGVGEAGVQPPGVSLIGDHFPRERRGSAFATMQLGAPVGSFLGALGGGWIAHLYGWRAAFLALAVPGLIIAALFRLMLREPPRGMSDPQRAAVSARPPPFTVVLSTLDARPEFRQLLLGLALATIALYGSGVFLTPFYARVFNLGVAEAAGMYALTSGGAAFVGLSVSGFAIDWLGRRSQTWYALLPAIGLAVSAPLYVLGYRSTSLVGAVVLITLASVMMFCFQAPTMTALQNMVDARMRASAAFVYSLTGALIGLGIGPPIIGLLSDRFARQAFAGRAFLASCPGGQAPPAAEAAVSQACAAASAAGVRSALMVMACVFLWSAFHYFLAFRKIRSSDIAQR